MQYTWDQIRFATLAVHFIPVIGIVAMIAFMAKSRVVFVVGSAGATLGWLLTDSRRRSTGGGTENLEMYAEAILMNSIFCAALSFVTLALVYRLQRWDRFRCSLREFGRTVPSMLRHSGKALITGCAAVALAVALWFISVLVIHPLLRSEIGKNFLWAATLWLAFGVATFFVSTRKWATSPRLGCTVASAIFVILYRFGEGPIGENVTATLWVYTNLAAITLFVFAVSEVGVRYRQRRTSA